MRILPALVLTLAASVGCDRRPDPDPFYPAVPNPDPAKQKDEEEIRIVAFRELLKGGTSGETCFIAFQEASIDGWIYPSNDFLAKLQFPQLKLRTVREAQFPAKDERDPQDPDRYQGIRDPQTGKRSYVYWVRVEWLTADRVKAYAGMTGGPLSGGGSELIIAREAGVWVLKETGARWVH